VPLYGADKAPVKQFLRRLAGQPEGASRVAGRTRARTGSRKVAVQYAIIVCERAADVCPRLYPFTTHTLHWPFADPQRVQGAPEARVQAFRDARDTIDAQVQAWPREA
jgi:hypothetical protein